VIVYFEQILRLSCHKLVIQNLLDPRAPGRDVAFGVHIQSNVASFSHKNTAEVLPSRLFCSILSHASMF